MSHPEAAALMRRAEQSLREATVLLDEELWAGAASRAYYAMYQASQAILADKGVVAKTHKGVRLRLQELGALDAQARSLLGKAQAAREHADYDAAWSIAGDEARQLVDDAKAFVKLVEAAL